MTHGGKKCGVKSLHFGGLGCSKVDSYAHTYAPIQLLTYFSNPHIYTRAWSTRVVKCHMCVRKQLCKQKKQTSLTSVPTSIFCSQLSLLKGERKEALRTVQTLFYKYLNAARTVSHMDNEGYKKQTRKPKLLTSLPAGAETTHP